MNDILSALRAATAEAHRQLEDAVDIPRRVTDPARYRRLLEVFRGYYRSLEDRLARVPGHASSGLDLADRQKTPWLEADLIALGLSRAELAALPVCVDLPPTHSTSCLFGCLYVLEGATLGGRQITAMLQDSPVPLTARRFFGSYGAETGARWRKFLAALETYAGTASEDARAELVGAAEETFSCLHDWFVRECPAHEHPG